MMTEGKENFAILERSLSLVFLERSEGTVTSYPDQSGTLVKRQIITSHCVLLMMTVGRLAPSSKITKEGGSEHFS